MRLQRIGLGLRAYDSIVYDVYALMGDGGAPVRCERTSCFQPLLDCPGWHDAVAVLDSSEGRMRQVRYVIEGTAGAADFTLSVKLLRCSGDPAPPQCIRVAPPAGDERWAAV